MYDIKNLKATKSILKRQEAKSFFFSFFVLTKVLNLWPQVLVKCEKKIHARKYVKMYIKIYVFIFCISGFLPKYLCIITYACEKSPPP